MINKGWGWLSLVLGIVWNRFLPDRLLESHPWRSRWTGNELVSYVTMTVMRGRKCVRTSFEWFGLWIVEVIEDTNKQTKKKTNTIFHRIWFDLSITNPIIIECDDDMNNNSTRIFYYYYYYFYDIWIEYFFSIIYLLFIIFLLKLLLLQFWCYFIMILNRNIEYLWNRRKFIALLLLLFTISSSSFLIILQTISCFVL